MSFLTPWLAVGIAAVAVPVLLILYFLKLRRREELVPSTLLWKRAVQDLQVNAPFQRLRKNLLLFLQLLILAAAILALARPIVETTAASEGRLVILIDRSASMNTREGDQTRLEHAKEQAVRLVKTLNRRSASWFSFLDFRGAETKTQAMVVALADRATVVSPFTPNTADLVDVIRAIEPTDGRTNIREALELAEAYLSPPTMTTDKTPIPAEAAAKVVLLSDGAIAGLAQAVLKEGTIELIKIGRAQDNVGITTLRAQRNYERPEVLDVFLQVQNFGAEPVSTDVSLLIDGALAGAPIRTIMLGPAEQREPTAALSGTQPAEAPSGSAQGLSLELTLERAAVIEARLSREDALAADNRAWVVVPAPRKLRVLVVTEKNFFLDSVLRGLPLAERPFLTPVQYEKAAKSDLEADGQSKYDVVIFDKYRPGPLPAGNYLLLGTVPKLPEVQVAEELEQSFALIWWDDTHPVLRHVALDYVYVGKGLVLKLPAEAHTLIEGPRGPLLARYLKDGRHYLILGFAIENSTWWQKPSFPVFMYNALRYVGSGGAATEQEPTRPGGTLRVALPEGVGEARLMRPDGTSVAVKPDLGGTAYYGGTERIGVYRVSYRRGDEDRRDSYAVNLEDAWESDIRPRGAEEIGSTQVTAGRAIQTATPEVWRWFVGAALAIVLLEWWVYNRRVMI